MFCLARQIRQAADFGMNTGGRSAGVTPPALPAVDDTSSPPLRAASKPPWASAQTLRHINPIWFADVAEEHGPDRLMTNLDHVAYVGNDMMAIPKAIREILRRSVDRASIRSVVFHNVNSFYNLALDP